MDFMEIAEKIRQTDAILLGASNGFSISEGLHIFVDNAAFEELFGDFKRTYGVRNILTGCFANWPSEELRWCFLGRLIKHYCIGYTGSQNTDALKTIQCGRGCHDTLYPLFPLIPEMAASERNMKISTELVPRCPKCGGPMVIHSPQQYTVAEDVEVQQRFQRFIQEYHGKKIVILELGIGWRNQLIKAPLMRLAAQEPEAVYITLNKGEIYIPDQIAEKSYGLDSCTPRRTRRYGSHIWISTGSCGGRTFLS